MLLDPVPSPTTVLVRCSRFNVEGRLVNESIPIGTPQAPLPENCTVGELILQIRDMLDTSPRQPVELLHWGKALDPTRLLSDYFLTPNSELNVIVHPRLPAAVVKVHKTHLGVGTRTRTREFMARRSSDMVRMSICKACECSCARCCMPLPIFA